MRGEYYLGASSAVFGDRDAIMAGFLSITSSVISWPERAEDPPSEVKMQTYDKIR